MASKEGDIADELRVLLGPLHRALSREAEVAEPVASLTRAQAEILRALAEGGAQTVTQLAARLALARPTVSNLVKVLVDKSMVTRELSQKDARSTLLKISPDAQTMVEDAGRDRLQALQQALGELDVEELQVLDDSLPVFRRLLSVLQSEN